MKMEEYNYSKLRSEMRELNKCMGFKIQNRQADVVSLENLKGCSFPLQTVSLLAMRVSQVEFVITEGYTPIKEQMRMRENGFVGEVQKAHETIPSRAVDASILKDQSISGSVLTYREVLRAFSLSCYVFREAFDCSLKLKWGGNCEGYNKFFPFVDFENMNHFEITAPLDADNSLLISDSVDEIEKQIKEITDEVLNEN